MLNAHIRPRGVLFFIVGLLSCYVYGRFVFDAQVKFWLEKELSLLNGARVTIGELNTNLLRGELLLTNVEFGNPISPMRNTFEVGQINAQINVSPLFRKKLHISNMNVEKIRHWTQRQTPGTFDDQDFNRILPAALMDRASTGIYSGIRNELTDNPLRHLGQLGSGFTLPSRLGKFADKLSSVKHLKKILSELSEQELVWEKKKTELPSPAAVEGLKTRLFKTDSRRKMLSAQPELTPREELSNHILNIKLNLNQLQQLSQNVETEMKSTDHLLQKDISVVRRELGIPDTQHSDITNMIFGPSWLGLLEKLSYWIDFSRQQSPVGIIADSYGMTVMSRKGQRSVHFGKVGALPSFLLSHVTFTSGNSAQPDEITINGTCDNLSSDPVLLRLPTHLSFKADYPEKGFRNLVINAVIDHTGEVPKETLNVSIDAFKLTEWPVTQTPDVQITIAKALAGLELTGKSEGNQIDFQWNISLADTEYEIRSRFRQIEQSLGNMLAGLYSFDVQGAIRGGMDSLQFESQSGLGKRLAEGLKTEFRHEFGALDDAILQETKNLLPPIQESIAVRLRKLREETIPAFENTLKVLIPLETGSPATVPQTSSHPS